MTFESVELKVMVPMRMRLQRKISRENKHPMQLQPVIVHNIESKGIKDRTLYLGHGGLYNSTGVCNQTYLSSLCSFYNV